MLDYSKNVIYTQLLFASIHFELNVSKWKKELWSLCRANHLVMENLHIKFEWIPVSSLLDIGKLHANFNTISKSNKGHNSAKMEERVMVLP